MSASEVLEPLVERLAERPGVHAVLLYGADKPELQKAAFALARRWLCPQQGCGDCPACRALEAGRMVDFMHYLPWGPSNLLKLWAVRPQEKGPWDEERPEPPLRDFLRTAPLMARHKVALFEDAHRMTSDTANALLKTLEEPPGFGKVILTTTEVGRILPTVRSRCLAVPWASKSASSGPWPFSVDLDTGGSDRLQAAYATLAAVFESATDAPAGAFVALAERTRDAAEGLVKPLGTNTRGANAEALRCLAEWLARTEPDRPELAQAAIEAHRLVLGNLNPGPVLDHLWWQILSAR